MLVFNDEAHHAYRIKPDEDEKAKQLELIDNNDELQDYEQKEATVWIEGLDKINKHCGISALTSRQHLITSIRPETRPDGHSPG